jgi:hypothetical protein
MKPRRFHAVKILEWCKNRYGRSKYNKGKIKLIFRKPDWTNEDLFGEYDAIENSIYINPIQNETLELLVNTVIEEYCHYLNSDSEYQKLYEKYDYDNHPHEVKCKRLSSYDTRLCLNYLRRMHHQFDF